MSTSDKKEKPLTWWPYRLEIRGELKPDAPFRIGSGQQLNPRTDTPILRGKEGKDGGDGKPYLPGTSIRGVLRHLIESELALLGCNQDHVKNLFGYAPGQGDASKESSIGRLTIDDAVAETAVPSEVRDHVKIDPQYGSAAHGAKFDAEVCLAEATSFDFHAIYEGQGSADPELILLIEALQRLSAGEVCFGARSSCGFGRMTLENFKHRAFDRGTSKELAAWFGTRLNPASEGWTSGLPKPPAAPGEAADSNAAFNTLEVSLRLCFEGPMLVRAPIPPLPIKAADLPGKLGDPRTYAARGEQVAVMVPVRRADSQWFYLPGSSIRGVLRHLASRIVKTWTPDLKKQDELLGNLFGLDLGLRSQEPKKGRLEVGDAACEQPVETVYLDHVAIDRITNAASDGAKFSVSALASPCFVTRVRVQFKPNEGDALFLWALLLRDLLEQEGRLWMGASTARGYGYLHHAEMTAAKVSLHSDWAKLKLAGGKESGGRVRWDLGAGGFEQLRPLWDKIESARQGGTA